MTGCRLTFLRSRIVYVLNNPGKSGGRRSFFGLIGDNRSLRDAVEKGRAAVLYLRGQHVLLTGPSGLGKTFFAELRHRFACERATGMPLPLVYFNCADSPCHA